jgi:hypothetical protein
MAVRDELRTCSHEFSVTNVWTLAWCYRLVGGGEMTFSRVAVVGGI